MRKPNAALAILMSLLMMIQSSAFASSHREAPITALDHAADITDLYAFVSYDHPDRVTLILNVDPFLQPSNGPNYFPFDPNVLYEIKIDNNQDAQADVTFQFRFQTEIRAPQLFTGFAGAGAGLNAPPNSPPPVAPGTQIVPPAITALDGQGSEGLSLRQTYTVTIIKGDQLTVIKSGQGSNGTTSALFAVPSNVGPRTMPNYEELARQGIYQLEDNIRVFAGTVADPFFIDLGAAFDSLNFRQTGSGVPGVLTPAQDLDDHTNLAPNAVSGFNVNSIAIEVPIKLLTSDGRVHPANEPEATLGIWGTTSRPEVTIRRSPLPAVGEGPFRQVQRFGNPLINEVIIGTGFKDRWSMEQPKNDSQFVNFDLDPTLARLLNAIDKINIPQPPRTDLLPLVTYAPPIAAPGTPSGPIADLMRLNTGIPPTAIVNRKRLGLLAGDAAGFPNGRRVTDDVVDIAFRVVGGGVLNPKFNVFPNNLIGDGVNAPDVATQETFPYVHFAYDGRDSHHIDPGELGCGVQPTTGNSQGGNTVCPTN